MPLSAYKKSYWNVIFEYLCPYQKKTKKATETLTFKRPEGMHREVYALLYSDKKYGFRLCVIQSD